MATAPQLNASFNDYSSLFTPFHNASSSLVFRPIISLTHSLWHSLPFLRYVKPMLVFLARAHSTHYHFYASHRPGARLRRAHFAKAIAL